MSDPKTERPELPTRLIQADWDYADAAEKERNEGPDSLSRPNALIIALRSAWAFTHAAERERDAEIALRQSAEREREEWQSAIDHLFDENVYYKTRAMFVCGLNKTYKAATGCGKDISGDEMYRCADCGTPFCKRCVFTHFTKEDKRIRAALAASPALPGLKLAQQAVKGLNIKYRDGNPFSPLGEDVKSSAEQAIQRLIDAEGK